MKKPIIKKGDKYNRLTAVRFDHRGKRGEQFWLFKCSCGNEKVINVNHVKTGKTASCGCLGRELSSKRITKRNTIHGMYLSREYESWRAMKNRCLNKKHTYYKYYGARGIKVCSSWMKFEHFYKDMGKRPAGTTLDRIDNNKGYCKNNCRWATRKEQANNRKSNHLLTFNGKTQNIKQWAEELGINHNTLFSRLSYGWSIDKALKN